MCKTDYVQAVDHEELQRQWREKVDELRSIDRTLESLRAELQQFELRRASIAKAEVVLRQELDNRALVPSDSGSRIADSEEVRLKSSAPEGDELLQLCVDITAACEKGGAAEEMSNKTTARDDPIVFSLNDDEDDDEEGATQPRVQDWETGLDVLNRKPSACDRAAQMRHRMALASLKHSAALNTSGPGSTRRQKVVAQQDNFWHRIGRTVSMF